MLDQYINDIHKLLLMQHLIYVLMNAKILLFHLYLQNLVILINNHLLMVLLNPIFYVMVLNLMQLMLNFIILHDRHQQILINKITYYHYLINCHIKLLQQPYFQQVFYLFLRQYLMEWLPIFYLIMFIYIIYLLFSFHPLK